MGDNFVAETYRVHFKKAMRDGSSYIKSNFEYHSACNSKMNSHDVNLLSRLLNTFIEEINKRGKLPKYVLVVLDDNIIQFLDYLGYGISGFYGEWLEWIVNEMSKAIRDRKGQLPKKAVKDSYPMIYWVAPPVHKNMELKIIEARNKFNLVLTSLIKLQDNMRVIRLKAWDKDNDILVDRNGKYTFDGLELYWRSIDASVKFNCNKHESFLKGGKKEFFYKKDVATKKSRKRYNQCMDNFGGFAAEQGQEKRIKTTATSTSTVTSRSNGQSKARRSLDFND